MSRKETGLRTVSSLRFFTECVNGRHQFFSDRPTHNPCHPDTGSARNETTSRRGTVEGHRLPAIVLERGAGSSGLFGLFGVFGSTNQRDKTDTRTIGEVILPDGMNLNQELVKQGWCWWYREYAPGDTELKKLEREAREERKGLWAAAQPVPPWEWRKK